MSDHHHYGPPARLRRRRDLASAGQIAVAVAAVALGGGISTVALATFVGLSAWALRRRVPPPLSASAQRLWTLGVFAVLVATIARAVLQAEFLDAGVDFLLLLVVQRFFHRQRAREHMQLLLLGTLLMIVGAVINVELSYPVLLSGYVVVAVLALILNNLVAEGERLGPRVMLELSRESLRRTPALIRAAAGVSAMAAAGALLTFVVFPRWGVGAFLRGSMASETRSGFSNEVALGGFGTIKQDATVIMHIAPHYPAARPRRADWHLRGSAFDIYENGRWRTGRLGESAELARVWGYSALAPGGRAVVIRAPNGSAIPVVPHPRPGAQREQLVHATVTLEDIGADVLFTASEPLALRLLPRGPVEARARLIAGRNREFRVGKLPGPIQYEFISRVSDPSPAQLAAVGDPRVEGSYRAYLQRSAGLSAEVTALAADLTAGSTNRAEQVSAVMAHLATFRYTTDLVRTQREIDGADPLEGFVFESRAGHCEYFATALAVLLREVGVPTRVVNGYYGAHYNELGGFYVVRQADAHSWVEVHFGPLGWVTFDPTPPDGQRAGDDAPWWPAMSEVVEAVRSKYLEWVVGFDLGKQLEIVDGLGLRRTEPHRSHIAWGSVLAWTVGLAFGGVLLARLRGQWRRPAVAPWIRQWTRVQLDLAAFGHPARPGESPTAFGRRLLRTAVPGASAVHELARAYEALRFGPRPAPTDVEAVADLAREARLAIRRRA